MLPMIPFVALFAVLGLRYLTALAFPKQKIRSTRLCSPDCSMHLSIPICWYQQAANQGEEKSSPQLGKLSKSRSMVWR